MSGNEAVEAGERLLATLGRLAQWMVWVGGAMLIASAALVTAGVLVRWLFGITITGANEVTGYAFAISTSWSLAFTLLHRANVRIDLGYRLATPAWRAGLDFLSLLLLGSFVLLITWRMLFLLEETWANETISVTPLATPMIIPQSLWALGFLMFLVTWVAVLIRCAVALHRRRFAEITRLAGPGGIES